MRVLHQAAEIPVTPQYEVFDDFGRFVARVDLRIGGTQRAHEYDGADHRERDVHEQDLARDRRLLGAGWQRHGFTSRQLLTGGAEIIADADRLLGRPWDARRLPAWRHMIEHSLYGRAGPRPGVPAMAAHPSPLRNRSDTTGLRPKSLSYVTGFGSGGAATVGRREQSDWSGRGGRAPRIGGMQRRHADPRHDECASGHRWFHLGSVRWSVVGVQSSGGDPRQYVHGSGPRCGLPDRNLASGPLHRPRRLGDLRHRAGRGRDGHVRQRHVHPGRGGQEAVSGEPGRRGRRPAD